MSDTAQIFSRTYDAASPARVRDYIDLLKRRVMSLGVFTGLVGVLIAPGHLHPFAAALAVVAIALGSGAAGAINMWYERDLDALMTRTRNRPLPAGRVAPDDALGLGVLLSIFSVLLMAVSTNYVAAGLLAAAILFYVFVYTIWLKRRSPQNIVIGGAAGAAPALVGWAAVTGRVGWPAVVLFAIVFVWTPPHFWALSLRYRTDYEEAGVPMLPVVAGEAETIRQILIYSVGLVATSLLLIPVGHLGPLYVLAASLLGGWFVVEALRLRSRPSMPRAVALFRYSIAYLALLFAAVAVDVVIRFGP
jgi:protoheme IX farnesyltransferase